MMRAIIVEDEGLTSMWIKKKIQELNMGFLVDGVFSNGSQALEYLEKNEPDVIFTDIQMPVMDGLELLEQIQKMKIQPYKVILSAYDEFCYARRAMKLGAQEFVLKPEITEESLGSILEEARRFREQRRLGDQEKGKEAGLDRERVLRQLTGPKGAQGQTSLVDALASQGIELPSPDLMMGVVVFDGIVRAKPVMELLNLFLEQEQAGGAAFANSEQEFVLFYSNKGHEPGMARVEKLWEVLRTHMGLEVYVGVSRGRAEMGLGELYRQASVACENRRFFMIPGCQEFDNMRITDTKAPKEFCFFQEISEIGSHLRQKRYEEAKDRTQKLLEEIQQASYIYPAYVKTICNEFLAAYLQELGQYDLTEKEKEQVGTYRLLFGQSASSVQALKEEVSRAVESMTELLKNKSGKGYSPSVQAIVRYVEEHYGERISLAKIAETIYLSQSYASTLFKKETGKKFSAYVQEFRLEKSKEMLLHTRLSIQEIGDRAGFFDVSHFSHVFKERYQLSPLEYRKGKTDTKKEKNSTKLSQ